MAKQPATRGKGRQKPAAKAAKARQPSTAARVALLATDVATSERHIVDLDKRLSEVERRQGHTVKTLLALRGFLQGMGPQPQQADAARAAMLAELDALEAEVSNG